MTDQLPDNDSETAEGTPRAGDLLVSDLLMLGATVLAPLAMKRGLKHTRYDPEALHQPGPALPKPPSRLISIATKIAKGSAAGAALVGTGLMGKLLLDRSEKRRRDRAGK